MIIRTLLENGASIDYHKKTSKMTALHWLAYNNDRKAIKVLLEHKADYLFFNHDKQLAVDIAGTMPSYTALDYLLE